MSPPITITDGLKKFTMDARTSPISRPACRANCTAIVLPCRTRLTTSRLPWASTPAARNWLAIAAPLATASRHPLLPHRHTTSSLAVTLMCPMSPAAP